MYSKLESIGAVDCFWYRKNFWYILVHSIARALGKEGCTALPLFHAFTGCDTVSFFGGRRKKTAWNTWKVYGNATDAFCALAITPSKEDIEKWLPVLERFVLLLYDRTCTLEHVNDARKQIFTQKNRTIDGLPPT